MINVTDQSFESEVLKADKPVLVDFWAVWCGPCRIQDPILEEVKEALGDKAKFVKMNVDEQQQIPQQFNIMSIPTLMLFKNGTVAGQFIGVTGKDTLIAELQKLF